MKNISVNPPVKNETNLQGVGLLQKAFQILDLFQDEATPWTQASLVDATGMSRSTLSRLVRFLTSCGYLMETRGRYTLGVAAIDLGRRAQAQFNLVDLAGESLEELSRATSETIILTALDEARNSVTCLAQIPSTIGGLRVFESVGASYPLYSGASSKVVLAYLPQRRREIILVDGLQHVNSSVPYSKSAIAQDLQEIRKLGYAITHEETYPGVSGIAVPVLSPQGKPIGSIAIAAPLHRADDEQLRMFAPLLLEISKKLTKRLDDPFSGEESA